MQAEEVVRKGGPPRGGRQVAFNAELAVRVRKLLSLQAEMAEKRMFGGVAFLLRGKMVCGVLGDNLIVRVGAAGYGEAMAQPHVRAFDITGREMMGWVTVGPEGTRVDSELQRWLQRGIAFASTLAPK